MVLQAPNLAVIVWSKTDCIFCDKAKKLLEANNIKYEERNIQKNWSKEDLLSKVPNARTVPQIFIDENLIGGYTELVDYINNL